MTKNNPAALMSYVHSDDKYKQVTTLRERLSDEVQMQIGVEFPIFQDTKDIHWGQNWEQRINSALTEEITFLIPIITPSFFNSGPCCDELERFLEREKKLGRTDLILPIYFVDTPLLNDSELRSTDPLAEEIASRQYADWRELRFEPFTNPHVGKALEKLALQVRDALARIKPPERIRTKGLQASSSHPSAATRGETGEQSTEGPTTKREPPTVIVDPLHRGNFATLKQAIEQVDPGTRVIVRPGLYREGLIIVKPLEIIGDGEPGEVVIQVSDRNVILFQTTMGRIVNLTLRQMGEEKHYAVDIAQGRLELEDCDITSQSLSCIAIHDGADPRIRRNRIHDGKQVGVFVYDGGIGTLEDNDIFGNTLSGVQIMSSGNPTIRNNRIHDSRTGGGVYAYDGGQGTLEDNDIFGNALSGVQIRDQANPTLRRNRIHDNTQNGIFVNDGGQGIVDDNDIFGNGFSGVEIKTSGNPRLRHNCIHDGKTGGIYIHDNGYGTLEENDVFSNASSGLFSTSGANPVVRNNRINKNGSYGIWIGEKGAGTFENNDLTNNAKGAWSISEGSKANVTRTNNNE
jgi:F-box protein 11